MLLPHRLLPDLLARRSLFSAVVLVLALVLAWPAAPRAQVEVPDHVDAANFHFINLLFADGEQLDASLAFVDDNWQPALAAMALEVIRLSRNRAVDDALFSALRRHTGQEIENDFDAWYHWLWTQPENRYEHYAAFKSLLYRLIDSRFQAYFDDQRETLVRLDEVVWGGVRQDGIPPLRDPDMIAAADADWLEDDHVVFGVAINGDARAYPKRILAWHEMFVDEIGGTEFAGVYCTLCGAVILYETTHEGVRHELGTSGFLYRSNKLMYDRATQSLWNTTWGQPVIGPLASQDIELARSFVVTTTWGEWRRRHPDTTVLSLDTGHQRDYGEGVAYQQYFATDELMFKVPELDRRLNNKDEVLALVFPDSSRDTLAIAADYLAENPVYHDSLGEQAFVVLTDASGANRVYETGDVRFSDYDGDATATDADGQSWVLTEPVLRGPDGRELQRLPAHRAFWFGWYAANPETRLVH